ncbi:hypothetical protein HPB48_006987 [Haemaphysalis longicornis]|uniref:Endonuclease/exonuclease/phosphatase domain-containing protein n=1 Tax=Haemaphysalis longicornis TaxID=44386 RepID=A0A9J6GWC9_HAELO|nr:hypothetical protein HPB48_006987 [Haemaphysalis longicornis]
MVTLLPLRKQDPSLHILNIYSSPKLPNVTYADVFTKALTVAGGEPLVIVGDSNSPSPHWGYRKEERRGRKLVELISTLGLTLQTDSAHPTRIGNSVTRDTCPDLTLAKHIRHAEWLSTNEHLDSDDCIILATIRTHPLTRPHQQGKLPDWVKFRSEYTASAPIAQQGYATRSQHLVTSLRQTEQTIQVTEATPVVDKHLHILEARRSLVRRWRRQKHNRKLKLRIAALTQDVAEYSGHLADSIWVERCKNAAKHMSNRSTWRFFRALIDPSQTRTETQNHLQRALHACAGDADKLPQALRDKYICGPHDSIEPAFSMQARRTQTWIVAFNSTI